MDSDYKLFDSKEQEKESEKNKKKKDHSSGYYKFVNQFRNHLKKIENDFSGEEITQLPNHFNLINKYENEFEEQRENCLNCYSALKEQISLIEKVVPNFDVNIFNTFFQNFEEYYSFFTKTQEMLRTFSQFNDDTQNLFYICKRKNFCVDALKEFVDKISVEYADKIEEYEALKEKFKNLTESYDKLYKIYQETKSNDLKQYENIENKELMIKILNEKIQDLTLENDRVKKKYYDCSHELELLSMALKVKYVLKSESDRYINELKFKMKKFETDNINFRQEIKHLQEENEKLAKENEYLEEQIYSQLNNIKTSYDTNKNINLENVLEENEHKDELKEKEEEENSEGLDQFQTGNNLGDFLSDCEENETEEAKEENGQTKENNNNEQQNNDNINKKDTILSIEQNLNIDNIIEKKDNSKKVAFSNDIKADLKNSLRKSKSKNIKLRGIMKNLMHSGSVKIRYNKMNSNNINSAYNVMFQGRQFQFPSRIASKQNFDYFKQFFFLLFQAMKMNSDNISPFLEYDPQLLYAQCRSEHIPFHKYQKWLEKQIIRKAQIDDEKRFEDFGAITGIFCSSFL